MAEGKSVTWTVKLSHGEAAAISAAIGTQSRSAWLRDAALLRLDILGQPYPSPELWCGTAVPRRTIAN